MQYESGVKRRDLKQEIFSMAGIQELVLTFLDSLSHDTLRFNWKRETLDARIEEMNVDMHYTDLSKYMAFL